MRQPCTSTDTRAYFDRSKHVDRLEVNAYFGRSKTTLLKIFMSVALFCHRIALKAIIYFFSECILT